MHCLYIIYVNNTSPSMKQSFNSLKQRKRFLKQSSTKLKQRDRKLKQSFVKLELCFRITE